MPCVVPCRRHDPERPRHQEDVAGAIRHAAVAQRHQRRIVVGRGRGHDLIGAERLGDAGRPLDDADDLGHRRGVLLEPGVDAGREVDVGVEDPAHVGALAPAGAERGVELDRQRLQVHAPGVLSLALAALGQRRDAVIPGERHHVAALADLRVEVVEQLADRSIEAQQDVLHLVAVGPEAVARGIELREADRRGSRGARVRASARRPRPSPCARGRRRRPACSASSSSPGRRCVSASTDAGTCWSSRRAGARRDRRPRSGRRRRAAASSTRRSARPASGCSARTCRTNGIGDPV